MRQLPRRHNFWSANARRLLCLAVLAGMLCTYLPFPAVTGSGGKKDLSRPFPCQHRVCGCQSADQCWKSCCCFTNAQKVAWAETHQVELPQFVVVAAGQEAVERVSQDRKTRRCEKRAHCGTATCETSVDSADCAKCERNASERDAPAANTACQNPVRQPKTSRPTGSGVVLISAALSCQGVHWHWSAITWSHTPTIVVVAQMDPSAGPIVPLSDPFLGLSARRPPVPPLVITR
ncbi:MAG: hypothetical protein NT069_35185 [Planctomycetota bacterium]|nr:hypothetical protein [Planctomycetota bacterium]